MNGSLSQTLPLQCGIPQGTILGPLLFWIFINDLANCLSYSIPRMYADDASLTFTNGHINELDNAMASDLKWVNTWLNANKLK